MHATRPGATRSPDERGVDTVVVVALTLCTVGYEGRNVDDLLDVLLTAGVTRLVDVRELPLSRNRGLSKTALGHSLNDIGIAYEHMKPLGNPKENRERYWSGDVEGGAEIYRRHLHNGSYSTLVDLAESLDDGTLGCCSTTSPASGSRTRRAAGDGDGLCSRVRAFCRRYWR